MLLAKAYKQLVAAALKEDRAKNDITSHYTIPAAHSSLATIIAKERGVVCGMDITAFVFASLNKDLVFKAYKRDGQLIKPFDKVATVKGQTRAILSAERVALNFLSHLSGIASATRALVDQASPAKAAILSTRKTTPTLRNIQKYAVRVGGGSNHRTSLSDWVLIKDNHLRASGCVCRKTTNEEKIHSLIKRIRKNTQSRIEVEVETLDEFIKVAKAKPDIIMLDNFSLSRIRTAVELRNQNFPSIKLEASGGITKKTIAKIAASGVDFISVGAITHSSKAVDFSLEFL